MKHHSLFYILGTLILVSLACGSSTPETIPTITSEPPTATAIPTETLTPTATPNRTATVISRATASAGEILEELDELIGDTEIPYQDGQLLWKQNERLDIVLNGPDSQYIDFARNVIGRNFILKSDVTWNSTGILVCGTIFRSEANIEEGRQYHFVFLRFSGAPAWAIEFFEFGRFKNTPTKTQFSSALNQDNNETNQFVLIAQEGEFTLYINKVRQGRFFDYSEQQKEGAFAFFAGQDSGEGSCEYENSWVWELE